MNDLVTHHETITNDKASLTVDLYGGAIIDFHLNTDEKINPLSFAFTKEQMPGNNKKGAVFQGHFLCLSRWGLPSEGEIKAGACDHGEFSNIEWKLLKKNKEWIEMFANNELEGLQIKREIKLDEDNTSFTVKETVSNTRLLGRLYNMVQHPTLAEPFLDKNLIVDCNGTEGFDQSNYKKIFNWPYAELHDGSVFDLRTPGQSYNSVYSFIADPSEKYAWITAYSKKYHLVFGYIWKRIDYPWIHLWQHFENNKIKYRGIEFGTAAIHQPFKKILEYGTEMLGVKTMEYIDAGEELSRGYTCFLMNVEEKITGISKVEFNAAGKTIGVHFTGNQ